MLLSRSDMFAIVAVVDIAINGQGRPVKGGDIGRRHGLPERYLEMMLQALSRSGILTAKRGKDGGYQLARAPNLITADDILRAVRATQNVVAGEVRSLIGMDIVMAALQDAQMALSERLQRITVDDLARRAEDATNIANWDSASTTG